MGKGTSSSGWCTKRGKKKIKGRNENQEGLVVVLWLLLVIFFYLCCGAMGSTLCVSFHKLLLCLVMIMDVEE